MQSVELMAEEVTPKTEPSELDLIMVQIRTLGEQITALDAAVALYARSVTAPEPEQDPLEPNE